MLFFKDLKNEKMADMSFKSLYDKECHICATTMEVVHRLDNDPQKLDSLLSQSSMTKDQWEALKSADCCNPEQVFQLCDLLGIKTGQPSRVCRRWKGSKI